MSILCRKCKFRSKKNANTVGETIDIVLRVAEEAKKHNNSQNTNVNVAIDNSSLLADKERLVGFLLGVGILCCPWIFAWFTLRKGHTTQAKVISFIWMSVLTLVIVL